MSLILRGSPKLILGLLFLTLATGCAAGESDNHAIRRTVIQHVRSQGVAVDDLVIRLSPGELRENLGFAGETVFLIGDLREEEYWKVRDHRCTYLFLKGISLNEDKTTATIEIEVYLGEDEYQREELVLERLEGDWKIVGHRPVGRGG